jgi:hypothetical protein
MRKSCIIISAVTLFLAQSTLAVAHEDISAQCTSIATACKNACFTDKGKGDKSFWFGCMKPILHGKTVKGVTLDPKTVSECRDTKIEKMKKEIQELEAVK